MGGELTLAVGEHRVVDRLLGVEVRVEARRPHAHPPGELPQRQRGQPVLVAQDPRGLEDLAPGPFPALLDAVGLTVLIGASFF